MWHDLAAAGRVRRRTLLAAGLATAGSAAACTGEPEPSATPPPPRTRTPAATPTPPRLWPLPERDFLLRDVVIFDGERILEADSVRVEDGYITAVDRSLPAGDGIPVVPGAGRLLLPGLIDAHVHATPEHGPAAALRFGSTTLLDMHTDDPSWLPEAREARAATGRANRADLWSSGVGVTAPGGHPTRMVEFDPIPTLAPGADPARFVADRIAEGSDYIKLFLEPGTNQPMPTLTAAQLRALVRAAHDHGVMAVCHVSETADAVTAVNAGVDMLVHVPFASRWDDRELDAVATAGTPVIATLRIVGGGGRPADNTGALHAAGVPVLAGTDALPGSDAYGSGMFDELSMLVAAGLSPTAALSAATSGPAGVFGLTDRGRVGGGKRADLLLVDGDPTADIDALSGVAAVWKNGYPVDLR